MAHELEHMKLVRVVIREDFSRNRSELLLRDIITAMTLLDSLDEKTLESHR